jgi:hypothetical protein
MAIVAIGIVIAAVVFVISGGHFLLLPLLLVPLGLFSFGWRRRRRSVDAELIDQTVRCTSSSEFRVARRASQEASQVSRSTVSFVTLALTLVLIGGALATPTQVSAKFALRCTGKLTDHEVTGGGVSARGRCTASGGISDKGTFVDYRTVKGSLIKVRRVFFGNKGSISFAITINTSTFTSRWIIASSTQRYQGLRGSGTESSNLDSTPARLNLTGTVSR